MSSSTAYASAALDAECAILASSATGRNHQVNLSGFNMGQLIPGGHLDRHDVERRLWCAAEASGIVKKDGAAAVKASLRSGIESGMRKPRDIGAGLRVKTKDSEAPRPKPKLSDVPVPDWTPPDEDGKPKLISLGQAAPKRFDDEARRHRYMRDGLSVRFKIKKAEGWVDWYLVKRPTDGATGWQAKKPAGYVPVPYLPPDASDPFKADRRGEVLVWGEGEKDCDVLHRHGFHAFSFGSASDVPDVSDLLAGHHVVVAVDNDKAGRDSIPRKIKAVIAAGAASIRLVQFSDLPEGGDCADFFEAGGSEEDFLDRAERIDPATWRETEDAEGHVAGEGRRKKPAAPTHGSNESLVTEDEGAILFADRHRGELRYCHDHGAWFEWTGAIWKRNGTSKAFHFARELARQMAEGQDHKTEVTARKAAFAGSVERFARADPAFAVTSEVWDCDPWLLGTPGGVVDLRTGTLRSAKPEDGITKTTAIAPTDHADCPLWLRFLDEATNGDVEMIRFLQLWAGYSLTGDTREHALVFVFGPGGNGKSVAVNVQVGIMGDYAVTASMDVFIASSGDRHPTDLAMLRGARLVTASETEEGRQWAESRIKQLTGGDRISARFMRQDFFTFLPSFKLQIIGNHKPGLRNVDDAARRRFNLVPFVHTPAAPDRQLEEKLKAEWPGILRWMIEGCLMWQRDGLVKPASVKEATAAYFADQDTFSAWLEEECEIDPRNRSRTEFSADLFAAWSRYAKAAGEAPMIRKAFGERMQRSGAEPFKGTGGVRMYRGIHLRPSARMQGMADAA